MIKIKILEAQGGGYAGYANIDGTMYPITPHSNQRETVEASLANWENRITKAIAEHFTYGQSVMFVHDEASYIDFDKLNIDPIKNEE